MTATSKKRAVVDAYPMSMLQQGMVFHSMQRPDLSVYHDVLIYRFNLSWDAPGFEQSLNYLIAKHSVLRTLFHLDDARPLQLTLKPFPIPYEFNDLRSISSDAQDTHLGEWIEAEKKRGVDLKSLPWRICVHQLNDSEFAFGMSFHHAMWDGWSNANFISEFLSVYNQVLEQGRIEETPTPPSYKIFVAMEQKALASADLESYWRSHFSDVRLPWWSGTLNKHSRRLNFPVSTDDSQKLSALARSLGVQEKSVWVAIYMSLLALIDGSDEVVGSVVMHGRPEIAGGDLILGLFLNSLPVKLSLQGKRWRELLVDAEEELKRLATCKHYPLVKVQEVTGLDFSASMFNYTNFHVYSDTEADSNITSGGGFEETNYRFDFHVAKDDRSGRFGYFLNVDPTVFDEDLHQRMGDYVATIIDRLVSNPSEVIRRTTLLGKEEVETLTVDWTQTRVGYPDTVCVHQQIEGTAARTPGALAVVDEAGSLTYAELNAKANRLAHHLRSQGTVVEDRIGVLLDRSVDMVVALLGILKSGACYVPLDPEYPPERISQIVTAASIKIVITQSSLMEIARSCVLAEHVERQDSAVEVVSMDEERTYHQYPDHNPSQVTDTRNLAYVIYTSGSTGSPKGVAVEHGPLVNRLDWMQRRFALTPTDRVLQKTPYSFDVSVWEFFWPLIEGAALVMAKPKGHKDPVYLQHVIEHNNVSVLHFVPSMLHAFLLGTEWQGCSSVRQVIASGEALSNDVETLFFERSKGSALENLYGPTEAVIDVSNWACSSNSTRGHVPIGKAIQNIKLYVCDDASNLVPIQTPGELLIGGVGLARGYIGQPGLTAERFIPDPYSSKPGSRLYRTGDLVRFENDGNIQYLGRLDHQVKIRGFRIELGEIESVLAEHPQVTKVHVLAKKASDNQERLVAYVRAQEEAGGHGSTGLEDQLRVYLEQRLPTWMVPSAFVVMTDFPITLNGKLDRSALPDPDYQTGDFAEPEGETESLLANEWCSLLGLERVGRDDRFFDLGAHSLIATQLVARIRKTFEVEVAISSIFDYQSLRQQARFIEHRRAHPDSNVLSAIPARTAEHSTDAPLSYSQQRLWFLHRFNGPNAVYNLPLHLRLRGTIQLEALQQSIAVIVERHEILRTRFTEVDGGVVQRVFDDFVAPTLQVCPSMDQLRHLLRQESAYCFDLSVDPLVRINLYSINQLDSAGNIADVVLSIVMHHSISDGWSIGVFFRELIESYSSLVEHRPSRLASPGIQFGDFAHWQRDYLQGPRLARLLDFWKTELDQAPPVLSLPTDRPRPQRQTFNGSFFPLAISAELTEQLTELSREHGVTLFMSLLSAYYVLLSSWAGQDDIVVGTPIANRRHQETENLIGFFVNTLALRVALDQRRPFSELLRAVKECTMRAYAYQDLPFDLLVEKLNPERSLNHSPIFQVMFSLQNLPLESTTQSDLRVETFDFADAQAGEPAGHSRFDMWLTLHETHSGIEGGIEYNTDLFDSQTVERFAQQYLQVLGSITANRQSTLSELEILDEAQRSEQLRSFGAAQAQSSPTHECIHDLFEHQCRHQGDRIAVWENDQSTRGVPRALSYTQLNRTANAMAYWLHQQNNGKARPVVLCMQRSSGFVVSVLASVKAGLPYVPIDPSWPKSRIEFVIKDCDPGVCLSDEHSSALVDSLSLPSGCVRSSYADGQWSEYPSDDLPLNQVGRFGGLPAYIIYTSGSSGKPKGVCGVHQSLVNRVKQLSGTSEHDVYCQKTNIGFVDHVVEVFQPLSRGMPLVLIPDHTLLNTNSLAVTLNSWQISHLTLVPSLLATIAQSVGFCIPKMGYVNCSGEELKRSHLKHFASRFPNAVLRNVYGSTEVGADVTFSVVNVEVTEQVQSAICPIGKPIENIRVLVLSSDGHLLPQGAIGELHVSGIGLSNGYHGNPRLSAERFVPNPFGQISGDRLYRTGDLVRINNQGALEFCRRCDQQVKVRGYRVELAEISSTLLAFEQVTRAEVIARQSDQGINVLVAYVVCVDDWTESSSDKVHRLRQFVSQHLPGYMVPAYVELMKQLPLNSSGKVDSSALPEPDWSSQAETFEEPQGKVECELAELWTQLLQVERVGRFDDFFALGGHSLLAMQMIEKVDQRYQVRIQIADMFQQATVCGLAKKIELVLLLNDASYLDTLSEEDAERLLEQIDTDSV